MSAFLEPRYLLLLPAILLAIYAQASLWRTYNRYSRAGALRGQTGAAVAAELLRCRGINDVKIEPASGLFADHYDPRAMALRLSPEVHYGVSLAAVGIAAHEAGHVFQHRDGYIPLAFRSAIVPAAQIGTPAAWVFLLLGLILQVPRLTDLGILLLFGYALFALVTLPLEFNASARAVHALQGEGLALPHEAQGVRAVMNAAALTYVAAAIPVVFELIRLLVLRRMQEE